MDAYFNKMKDYLKMDSEIPYEEFNGYTQEVIEALKANFESQDQEQLFQSLFIMATLKSNCEDRAARKGPLVKKYKKLGEKADLWVSAINLKLLKLGLTQEQIEQRYEEIYETA